MDNYYHKNQQMSTAVATATLLAMGVFIWALVKKRANSLNDPKRAFEAKPAKWQAVGEVARLCVYPLEAGRSVKLSLVRATHHGFENGWNHDRMFILVDDQGRALSGRVHRRSVLISCRCIKDGVLELSAKKMETIQASYYDAKNTAVTVWYKRKYLKGVDLGDQVADWLTKFLVLRPGKDYQAWGEVRLAYCDPHQKPVILDDEHSRLSNSTEEFDYRGEDGATKKLLAEECKLDPSIGGDTIASIVSTASLGHLNDRLMSKGRRPVSYKHFRPNIVISKNDKPYSEDKWLYVKMGEAIFHVVRPSTRCVLSAVNPRNGEPEPNFEPLPTLKEYHAVIDETEEDPEYYSLPAFGVLLGLIRPGSLSIGDPVYVST